MKRVVLLMSSVPLAMFTGLALLLSACSDDPVDEPSPDAASSRDGAAEGGGKDANGDRGETGGSAGSAESGSDARDATGDASEAAPDGGKDALIECGAPHGPLTSPMVPAGLVPPSGATLTQRFYAVGSQIYTCTGGPDAGPDGGAPYAWTFKAPDANLYDDSCGAVGTHFGGPTWRSTSDGSSIVGSVVANTAGAVGAIPWLLLRAAANSGEGIFSGVTAVQRVETAGGVAPSVGCDASTVGTTKNVPYTAIYYFYTGGTWSLPEAGADVEASSGDANDGASSDAPADAVVDTASDVAVDTASDVAVDAASDVAVDAPVDSAVDAPVDSAVDAPVEASAEAG